MKCVKVKYTGGTQSIFNLEDVLAVNSYPNTFKIELIFKNTQHAILEFSNIKQFNSNLDKLCQIVFKTRQDKLLTIDLNEV